MNMLFRNIIVKICDKLCDCDELNFLLITHLIYRSGYFENVTKWVPSSVTNLECSNDVGYNHILVPPSVTHLTLPYYNNICSIRKIPMHVEHVTYRNRNSYVDDNSLITWDDIPSHIKSITIGKFSMMRQ